MRAGHLPSLLAPGFPGLKSHSKAHEFVTYTLTMVTLNRNVMVDGRGLTK